MGLTFYFSMTWKRAAGMNIIHRIETDENVKLYV